MKQQMTRKAFINGVIYSMNVLLNGLDGILDKLEKLMTRACDMESHLDALSADSHSAQLTTVCKKLQKATQAVNDARNAIQDMVDDVSDGIVVEDEGVENGEGEEESKEQQQESTTTTTEESKETGEEEVDSESATDGSEASDEDEEDEEDSDELLIDEGEEESESEEEEEDDEDELLIDDED